MNAETIARALRGRACGSSWTARCPAHDDHEPSLSIREGDDGKVLVRCHAGCPQEKVIAALRSRGLWDTKTHEARRAAPSVPFADDRDADRRTDFAMSLWRAALPAAGTLVETYLASRGLICRLPETLRYHPRLKHPSGSHWPAMVALVTRGSDDAPLGVHRTFLAADGSGKAPVVPQKMMLGPCRGGAVRLGIAEEPLMIGEGIETCLAAMQATGKPAWAALSTSGLRSVDLPADIDNIIILADGDEPGEAAARNRARRWQRAGRCVRIARPPAGMDFNDLLMADAATRPGGML